MAKVFTQEEREKIKGQVVELVRLSGRETLRQLEAKTGATRYLMSVLARELVASGDVESWPGPWTLTTIMPELKLTATGLSCIMRNRAGYTAWTAI